MNEAPFHCAGLEFRLGGNPVIMS